MNHADRVILLTNYFVYSYRNSRGKVVREKKIELSENKVESLGDLLKKSPQLSTRIIVNVLEEEYVFEILPHAVGADGKHLVRRKLNQHFRQSDFKQSVLQGRQKVGRRDQEVMLSSLGNCEDLKKLIDMLFDLEVPITGIYSAPQLCARYLAPVLKRDNVLIMTEIDNGILEKIAVRQSFFHEGKLRLTRVGMIDVTDEVHVHHDVEESLESSRRYLLREKLIGSGDKLDVVFVTSTQYLESLDGYSDEALSHFSFNHIKTKDLANYIDAPTTAENGFEDIIATCRPAIFSKPHYQSLKSSYFSKYRNIRTIATRFAVAVSIAFLIMSGLITYKSTSISDTLQIRKDNLASLEQTIARLREASAQQVNTYDIYQIKDSVDTIRQVRSVNTDVLNMYEIFSSSLESFPEIKIKGLSWESEEREVAVVEEDDLTVDEEMFDVGIEPDKIKQQVLVAKLVGKVLSNSVSVRAMLDGLNEFANEVNRQKQVKSVSFLRMPIAIQPDESLSGQIIRDASNSDVTEKTFELEVVIDYANG